MPDELLSRIETEAKALGIDRLALMRQIFRERWGRWPAKAEKRVVGNPTTKKKPAVKVTKKAAKPKPKAKQARRAPNKKARRP